MMRLTPRLLAALTLCLPLAVFAAGMATVSQDPARPAPKDGYLVEQLAHASPDEYFFGIGSANNLYVPGGVDAFNCPVADTTQSVAKVNQSYIWGLGKTETDVYFGTLANGSMLVQETYLDTGETNHVGGGGRNFRNNYRTEVSEGDASYYGSQHSGLQDWRPPQLFHYNITSHSLSLLDPDLPADAQYNLTTLAGIRAGGSATTNKYNSHRMVLLAGPPAIHAGGGVGFFLFDASTTQYVATTINTNYNNVRRMACINGDLYFGVQKPNTLDGAIIRWVNNPSAAGWPFIFQEVGALDNMGADICIHEGRLFCTTWPGYVEADLDEILQLVQNPAELYKRSPGLWMSPVVPAGGLTTAHRTQWQKVWSVANYEPDQMIGLTLGGGALASFDGYLYFGTMQVPGTGSLAFQFLYGNPTHPDKPDVSDPVEIWLAYTNNLNAYNALTSSISTNTTRTISIFRGRNFRTPINYQGVILNLGGDFETLYGYTQMPVYVLGATASVTNWVWTANKMGQTPSMGAAGFNNPNNLYTWTMDVFNNTLFVGTLDTTLPNGARTNFEVQATNSAATYGADLYRLHSSQASRFRAVSFNGLGNICNYGFRTMAADKNGLYIGTANPRNLRPNPTNHPAAGGWELLKLTRRPTVAYDMDMDFKADAAWMTTAGATIVNRLNGAVTNFSGATGVLAAWADYDRDGVADPARCNPATGVWTAWLSSRDNQQTTLPALASSGSVPVPADLDGDGKADQALATTATGKITWRSTKDGKTYGIAPVASPAGKAYIPAVGDYNGDGTAELVWYVPPVSATVTGRILRSSSTTAAKFTVQNLTGSFRGVPVIADYDGDGKADFALNNAATGLIRYWPSTGGAYVDSLTQGAGWLPMVADYDGDGYADYAWYNPTTGTFRIGLVDTTDLIPVGARPVAAPAAVWYTK